MTEKSKAITPIEQVQQGLDKFAPKLQAALPKGMSIEKFNRTAMQGIQTHRDQDKLLRASRKSLFLAVQKAAGDGLQLDGREAALVVFKDEVAYMPMVQGLVRLARNSGEIKTITSEVVYENDKFVYRIGLDEMPLHEPDWFNDRGEPKGVWACIKLVNGEVISAILPKSKVMRIASKSRNQKQYDPKEGPYFDEWWKKTAIKNVLKYAPKSTELERLENLNAKEEFGTDTFAEAEMTVVNKVDAPEAEEPAEEKPKKKRAPRKTKAQKAAEEAEAQDEAPAPEQEAVAPHDEDGVIIDADYEDVPIDDDGVPM